MNSVSPKGHGMPNEMEGRIPLDDLLVFHQLTRSLTSSFDLDTILRAILQHMQRFVHADLWMLLMRENDSSGLYAIAAGGLQANLQELRVKVGEGVAEWVVEHGETLIVPDAGADPRVPSAGGAWPGSRRSIIALPLRGRKGTYGAIEIFNPSDDQMSDYTIAFLHILADHAAIAIENARDVARIQQLTLTDDTTSLYNVRYLYHVLGSLLDLCRRDQTPVSLAFLDLDRFKLVNDAHGHLVGSHLLALVGRRLRELSRGQDLCFRYGGDEFVVLMPATGAAEALACARNLHRSLMETAFHINDDLTLRVSASIGIAAAPQDGATVHAIVGAADTRMYGVKTSGRGQVRGV